MPGPAPKPPGTARRRNATVATISLPAIGWQGAVPEWPLIDDLSLEVKRSVLMSKAESLQDEIEETDSLKAQKKLTREMDSAMAQVKLLDRQIEAQRKLEVDLWNDLWRTPQAKVWNEMAWARDVAQYVRWKVLAEMGNLPAGQEARMWSDRLGLNPLAMLRLRWEIERVDEAVATGNARRASTTPRKKPVAKKDDPRQGLYAV